MCGCAGVQVCEFVNVWIKTSKLLEFTAILRIPSSAVQLIKVRCRVVDHFICPTQSLDLLITREMFFFTILSLYFKLFSHMRLSGAMVKAY